MTSTCLCFSLTEVSPPRLKTAPLPIAVSAACPAAVKTTPISGKKTNAIAINPEGSVHPCELGANR
ncbi:MAG: hypothetical protein E6X85_07245 [Veillonella sp.]|uniref:hypothetical protein n=1 Tax=Veillonella sp. TaxID=1926307 RepID=UPI00290C6457|nr:hypothetical protein [Veillonella sp.]MDU4763904.1 hypothetical protein [Veillonella sp.]